MNKFVFKIWHVTVTENGEATVNIVADLERHQKTVNVVRFSPSGEFLACGDDGLFSSLFSALFKWLNPKFNNLFLFLESVIILWSKKEGLDLPITPSEDIINKEQWASVKVLRGHVEDVYDLSWSLDSSSLASASLDNTVILWNVQKGKKIGILHEFKKGFPQGVSWDPSNKFIAAMSSDRYVFTQCTVINC